MKDELPQTKAIFQGLFEFSPDAIVVVNRQGDIVQINTQAEKIFGYSRDEILGKPIEVLVPERFREMHEGQRRKYMSEPRIRILGTDLELYGRKKDGREFQVDIALGPVESEEGFFVLAIVRDITEHKRLDQEIRMLLTLTLAINETKDLNAAIEIALRKVCEATGWNYGEAWVPSQDGTVLVCSPVWYSSDESLMRFRRMSERYTFKPGEGLPGRIWASKRPDWIPDVSEKPESVYRRVQIARETGLKASLGVPIVADDQVLAVLVFLMFEAHEKNKQLVDIVSAAATQLGSVIQRKQAEEALRESEMRLRSIVQSANDAIILADSFGRIISWNKGAQIIFGYGEKEVLGKPLTILMPERYREAHLKGLERVRVSGESSYIGKMSELHGLRKDGTEFPIELSRAAWKVGDKTFYSGIIRDITEHKRMDEALRQSEAKYRSIFENAAESIFQISVEGRILAANPALAGMLGYGSQNELIAEIPDFRKLFVEPGQRLEFIRTMRSKGSVSDFETAVRRKDGSQIWILINAHAMHDQAGRQIGYEGMAMNITNRKRAEKNFERLIESGPDAIVAIDRRYQIILVNTQAEKTFGYQREELLGRPYDLLIPERFREKHAQFCTDYFSFPITKMMAVHLAPIARRRDGSEFPVEINMSPIETEDGIIVVTAIRDISHKSE